MSKPEKHSIQRIEQLEISTDMKHVRIETPRLVLESVSLKDLDAYCDIFCNAEHMKNYQDGKEKTREWVEKRLTTWAKRWERGYPYSALKVMLKDTGEVIGHVVAGDGSEVGTSDLAFAFKKQDSRGEPIWNQYYGTEAVNAVVKHLVPLLKAHGEEVVGGPDEASEKLAPLKNLRATAHPEHKPSTKILENFLGKQVGVITGTEANDYKDARGIYIAPVQEEKRYQAFISKERLFESGTRVNQR